MLMGVHKYRQTRNARKAGLEPAFLFGGGRQLFCAGWQSE